MTLSTVNVNYPVSGISNIYVVPFVALTGATNADKVTAGFAKFYTDGLKRTGAVSVGLFGYTDDSGINITTKDNLVEANTSYGKIPVNVFTTDFGGTFTIFDMDVNKWVDIKKLVGTDVIATVAGVGQPGQTTALLGASAQPLYVTMLVETPSANKIVGAFDGYLFPKVMISLDGDLKYSPKDTVACKISWTALPNLDILSTETGRPYKAFYYQATAAATA